MRDLASRPTLMAFPTRQCFCMFLLFKSSWWQEKCPSQLVKLIYQTITWNNLKLALTKAQGSHLQSGATLGKELLPESIVPWWIWQKGWLWRPRKEMQRNKKLEERCFGEGECWHGKRRIDPPFWVLEPFCEEPRSSNGLKLIHEVAPKAGESRKQLRRLTTLREDAVAQGHYDSDVTWQLNS